MRALTIGAIVCAGLVGTWAARASAIDRPQGSANCVPIGTPKPSAAYTYRHTESTGNASEYTQRWESVTDKGSRVRVTRPGGIEIQVNEHRIVDDVTVLDRMSKLNANGGVIDTTSFRPGIVGDPAFKACADRSWQIPPVIATYQSSQNKASAATPAGTLRIVAIREKISVPAGTFETVHYIRTSQSTDEYWKSIDHGAIVKHIATLPVGVVTDVLISIR